MVMNDKIETKSSIWLTLFQLVPKSSAVVPGQKDVEIVGASGDHFGMVKYISAEAETFKSVSGHLSLMIRDAPDRIGEKWGQWKRPDGK